MEKTYPILLGGEKVGQASVRREGLYLVFDCVCRFSGEMLYKIIVDWGQNMQELGIPIPSSGRFRLQTKRPAKLFGEGEPEFRVVPKHSTLNGMFVPLRPEEPFAYLNRLTNAFLETRNGEVGLVIPADEV